MTEGELPEQAKGEDRLKTERWSYDSRFKYYLYRMGILGVEGVESINNFPERIELNDAWHNALGKMKSESLDGRERWVPIGMRSDRVTDFIPDHSLKGSFTEANTLSKAEISEKYGITYHIGDIHTHPSDLVHSLAVKLIVVSRLVKDFEGLSAPDIHDLVNGNQLLMRAVVEKSHNYFIFRTTETKDLQADSPLRNEMAFSRHWERKYGGYYFGKSRGAFWASPGYSSMASNLGIAEAYNLALYRGKSGEDLIREYPKIG